MLEQVITARYGDHLPLYRQETILDRSGHSIPRSTTCILELLDSGFIRHDLLAAFSLGAVFMGAATYIGYGPNFMVKSVAEQQGVRMPIPGQQRIPPLERLESVRASLTWLSIPSTLA